MGGEGTFVSDAWIIASESCALDIISARYIRDIEPGELVVIDEHGLRTYFQEEEAEKPAHCIFEFIYFSRPDSSDLWRQRRQDAPQVW